MSAPEPDVNTLRAAYTWGWEDDNGNIVISPNQKQLAAKYGLTLGRVRQLMQPRFEGEESWYTSRAKLRKKEDLKARERKLDEELAEFRADVDQVKAITIENILEGRVIPSTSEWARLEEIYFKHKGERERGAPADHTTNLYNLNLIHSGKVPNQRVVLDIEGEEIGAPCDD